MMRRPYPLRILKEDERRGDEGASSIHPSETGLAPSAIRHRRVELFLWRRFHIFFNERKMATLLPPPSKRQKTEIAEKARLQQEIESIPSDLGSIRVQFFDQATGSATGPAVSVPVGDATVKNLETLLNTLQGNVGMRAGCSNLSANAHFMCELGR
jgi:hypothetical protein